MSLNEGSQAQWAELWLWMIMNSHRTAMQKEVSDSR